MLARSSLKTYPLTMSKRYHDFIKLLNVLVEMEDDLGLSDLSVIEKDVFLAIIDLTTTKEYAIARDILDHRLTSHHSRPSVYRALSKLVNSQIILRSRDVRGGYFAL